MTPLTCSTFVSLRLSKPLTQSSSSARPTKNAGFCKPMPEAACAMSTCGDECGKNEESSLFEFLSKRSSPSSIENVIRHLGVI